MLKIHYPLAQYNPVRIPRKFHDYFDSDVIGFFIWNRRVKPYAMHCYRIVRGYLVEEYQFQEIINQAFYQALDVVRTLGGEGCLSICKTIEDHPNLLGIWNRFKQDPVNRHLVKFWEGPTRRQLEVIAADRTWLRGHPVEIEQDYHRFDYARWKKVPNRFGIPLEHFDLELLPVNPEHNQDPIKEVDLTKIGRGAVTPEELIDRTIYTRDITSYTFDELVKIYFSLNLGPPIEPLFDDRVSRDYFLADVRWRLAHIIIFNLRYTSFSYQTEKDWNTLAAVYNQIPDFDLGLDFEISLDWARNRKGRSLHSRLYHPQGDKIDSYGYYKTLWYDGKFAYVAHNNEKPILLISFSVGNDYRIYVTQIQLAQPRGNRWLYKLPCGLFDYVLLRLQEAFPQFKLLLIDGVALTQSIDRAYADGELQLGDAARARIIKAYNQELEFFDRVDIEIPNVVHYKYYHLIPRPQ